MIVSGAARQRPRIGNLALLAGIVCLALHAAGAASRADDARKIEFFEKRIRPVLVKHCYACHSADAEDVQGGLLVDTAAGLLKGGDSGAALVPGKPDESLLLEAMRYDSLEMPPAGRLPDNVLDDFARWIKMGAADSRTGQAATVVRATIDIEAGREFWSFQPPRRHPVPPVEQANWPQADIDRFILARLEAAGLEPAPDADRRTLIRRLYFDLIGLPPEPADVEAFLRDDSPTAVASLVDRLLESPQFGVHWGRHWLDVARYADSNGSDFNATFHNAWRYRDYVINAFNEDKPYNRFVVEQIAGDLLPYESDAQRTEQMVATGFLMVGAKMLSERDKEKLRMDVIDEQLDTVGRSLMGLTIGCARCHDHKFDPIPTRDYYALAGIFRSVITLQGESQQYVSTWKPRELPTAPEHVAAVEKYEAASKKLTADIAAAEKKLGTARTKAKRLRLGENSLVIDDVDAKKIGTWVNSTYSPNYVGKGYIHDDAGGKGEKSVEFTLSVPHDGLYDVRISYTPGGGRADNVPVTVVGADGERAITFNQQPRPKISNLFTSIGRFRFAAGSKGSLTISNRGTRGHVIVDAVQLIQVDENGKPVASAIDEERLAEANAAITELTAGIKELKRQLKELEENAPPPLPRAFAITERDKVEDCALRIRGEHTNLGPKIPRGFLQVALTGVQPPLPDDESGRLELARWIVGRQHPLTARVMVNRIWYHLLGEGIVTTLDNFGTIGARPTHPELLDRLAVDFMEEGWSVKRLIRRIVLSRTYQLSSRHDERSAEFDPENRWYWRARRRRLPAEAIRDAMLKMSGRLDPSPGGSPVAGLGTLVRTNSANDDGYSRKKSLRRSTYLPIIRNELPTMLVVFDFANPDLVTGKRPVTNVPAQALLLLNSPFVMDSARETARQVLAYQPRSERDLIQATYLRVLSREPTESEFSRAVEFLAAARTTAGDEGTGEPPDAEALSRLIHVLFASSEFRMLD